MIKQRNNDKEMLFCVELIEIIIIFVAKKYLNSCNLRIM
jgi:hypothetical protein